MAEIRHLENRRDVIFFCRGWSDLDKISQTGTEWHVDCGNVWKLKPDVEFQYDGRLGEFNGMSSQSHVSHCRLLLLGEFNVTIPEPHATLQGAVTWRNQCRDRATLQGVRIPSAILKIVFRHILFYFCFLCSLGFDERRLSYRLRYTCWYRRYLSSLRLKQFSVLDDTNNVLQNSLRWQFCTSCPKKMGPMYFGHKFYKCIVVFFARVSRG